MPDRNATDLHLGRDAHPPDEPTPAGHGDRVTPAPDGGAGGWEAFDDPDAVSRERQAGASTTPEVASRDLVSIEADPSGDAAARPADRQSPAEILQPGGELIGTPGTSTGIRELPGHQREAEELYERLSTGGREAAPPGYSGRAVELPDGGFVGLRLESKSGGPAIDVNIPDIEITRIHFR
jgi:hypothetical protein